MNRSTGLRVGLALGLIGVAGATTLVLREGAEEVIAELAAAGWGVLWVCLARAVPLTLSAVNWRVLIAGRGAGSVAHFIWLSWVREAVNTLLPVARIGGELVAVRLMLRRGIGAAPAVASLVVDMTLALLILLAFVAIGLMLLGHRAGQTALLTELVLGLAVSTLVVGAFVMVQRIGLFGLSGRLLQAIGGEAWTALVGSADRLDRAVRRTWRRQRRVIVSALWQVAAWLAGVGEMWLALAVLGYPVGFAEAFILEALIQGIAQAAFVVPGAVGVQEGGFVVLGAILGLPADTALALALIRRARDLVFYAPALIAWQALEGGWLITRLRRRQGPAPPAG